MGNDRIKSIRASLAQRLQGKPEAIDSILTCLVAGGHILIEDVPGVGKTTLAYALSQSIHCAFNRIQFTSDTIPSDITGVSVYHREQNRFEFFPGPIFANIVLADEINRASPKSQSALLEAMERGLVTNDRATHRIEPPFMVVATQNPVDFESTFPLPSAQLDRFLMRISLGYPDAVSERKLLRSGVLHYDQARIEPVVEKRDILELQAEAREIYLDDSIYDYLHAIVVKTRQHPRIEVGVSPRGALAFKIAAQAAALVAGRNYVTPEDVEANALPCLAHRLRLRDHHNLGLDWHSAATYLQEIVETVPRPHLAD